MTIPKTKLAVAFSAIMLSTGCATTLNNAGNFLDSSEHYDDVTGVTYDTTNGAPTVPNADWQKSCLQAKQYDPNPTSGFAGQAAGAAAKTVTDSATQSIKQSTGVNAFTNFIGTAVSSATNSAGSAYNNQQFQNSAENCVQNYAHKGAENGSFSCVFNTAFDSVVIKNGFDTDGIPAIPKTVGDCVNDKVKSGKSAYTRLNNFQMQRR